MAEIKGYRLGHDFKFKLGTAAAGSTVGLEDLGGGLFNIHPTTPELNRARMMQRHVVREDHIEIVGNTVYFGDQRPSLTKAEGEETPPP